MIEVRGDEFVSKILAGERDFSQIKLADLDVSGHTYHSFLELDEYLKSRDLKKEPIILNNSELSSIKAGGIWLPYLKANGASFKNAYFPHANFRCGEFPRASFYRANLEGANLEACDLYNVYFKETVFYGTQLAGARFKFADLAGVKDLANAVDLAFAHFEYTHVTPEERDIILDALRTKEDFKKFDLKRLFREKPTKSPA